MIKFAKNTNEELQSFIKNLSENNFLIADRIQFSGSTHIDSYYAYPLEQNIPKKYYDCFPIVNIQERDGKIIWRFWIINSLAKSPDSPAFVIKRLRFEEGLVYFSEAQKAVLCFYLELYNDEIY